MNRFLDFVFDNFAMITILTVIIATIVVLNYHHEPKKYIRAPVESCKAVATGRSEDYDVVSFLCAGYNSQGMCTVQVPVTNTYTRHEHRVQCDWKEWRG